MSAPANARERELVARHLAAPHLDERARLEPLLASYREVLLDHFASVASRLERGANTLRAAGGERAVGHANGLAEAAALVREVVGRVREGVP